MSDPLLLSRSTAARGISVVTLLALPCLFSFRFTSFMDAKLAALCAAAVLLALVLPRTTLESGGVTQVFRLPLLVVLLGVLWAAAHYVGLWGWNSGWASPGYAFVPEYAFAAGLGWALVIVAAALMRASWPAGDGMGMLAALAYSGVPVAVLGLLQYAGVLGWMFPVFPEYGQRVYSVFGNQDLFGGYLALMVSLLVALCLAKRMSWGFGAFAALVMFAGLAVSGSRTAWAAAAAGTGLACAMFRPTRREWAGMAGGAAAVGTLCVAFAPTATVGRIAQTFGAADVGYRVRLWIWDGALRMIADHPIAGVGLGNFRYFSPRYLGEALYAHGPGAHFSNALETLHAHSDYLEVLAETGLIGAGLVFLFFARLRRVASPAWALIAAGLTFSLANTTLHSPPHLLAMLLCVGVVAPPGAESSGGRLPASARRGLAIGSVGAVAAATVWFAVVPSFLLTRAESMFAEGTLDESQRAYADAIRGPGSPGEACYALAVLTANDARYREADSLMTCALHGSDTAQTHYVAGFIAEQLGDAARAATHYEASVARQPDLSRAWERLLAVVASDERDEIVARAEPWLDEAEAKRLRSLRESLDTAPFRPEAAGDL